MSAPACATTNPEVFFNLTPSNIATARATCDECSEKDDCLSTALAAEKGEPKSYRFGIFGGMTPDERFSLSY